MKDWAGPFELGDVGGDGPAVLCIHGLTGTPYEVRSTAEALAAEGFACLGPRLPGHLESPEVLARTPYQRWQEEVRSACDRLAASHARVYALGLSLGGLLALALCQERTLAGAVVLGAPLRLGPAARWLVPAFSRVVPSVPSRSDIRDPEALARHPSYDRMPLPAVRELMHLAKTVDDRLDRITVPLQLIYSRADRAVPFENAERIRAGVGSEVCRLEVLERSGHVMPVCVERERVAKIATGFLRELEGSDPAPGARD